MSERERDRQRDRETEGERENDMCVFAVDLFIRLHCLIEFGELNKWQQK